MRVLFYLPTASGQGFSRMKSSRRLALFLLIAFAVLQLRVALAACVTDEPPAKAVAATKEAASAVPTADADQLPCSNHDVTAPAAGTSDQALPSVGTAASVSAAASLYRTAFYEPPLLPPLAPAHPSHKHLIYVLNRLLI